MQVLNKKWLMVLFFIQPLLAGANGDCGNLFGHVNEPTELISQAHEGNIKALKDFWENATIYKRQEHVESILISAARRGDVPVANYLFKEASTKRSRILYGINGVKTVESLVKEDLINFDREARIIERALKVAVLHNQVDFIRYYLMETGVKPDSHLVGELLKLAAQTGKISSFEFFLSKEGLNWRETGTDPNKDSIKRKFIREAVVTATLEHQFPILEMFFEIIPNSKRYLPDSLILDFMFSITTELALKPLTGLKDKNRNTEIKKAFKEKLEFLIRNGANINGRNKDGDTSLHALVRRQVIPIEQWGYEKDYQNYSHYLISIIRIFDSLGANLYSRGKNGDTLAHAATEGGNIRVIQELDRRGHDLTLTNDDNKTVWNQMKKYKKLLTTGSSPATLTNYKRITYKQIGRKLMLEEIKNSDYIDRLPPDQMILDILSDTLTGSYQEVYPNQILIDILSDFLLNPQEFKEWLPVMISKGVNPNAKNSNGEPALHIIQKQRNYPHDQRRIYTEILLKNGANPNATNKDGDTILHVEVKHISEYSVYNWISNDWKGLKKLEFLINNGVDPNLTNHAGKTALDIIKELIASRENITNRSERHDEKLQEVADFIQNAML